MALRFRKSTQLARGVRMNVIGGGISWRFGPRDEIARFGKRGTFLNAAIPDAGLSSRTQLSSPTAGAALPVRTKMRAAITADVASDGRLRFCDEEGNALAYGQITIAKREQADALRAVMAQKCVEINAAVASLGRIHTYTPSPHAPPSYEVQEFSDLRPTPIKLRNVGMHERLLLLLFRSRYERVQREAELARAAHDIATQRWAARKVEFLNQQADRKRFIEKDILHKVAAMEAWLEENLNAIEWPRETLVSFEVSPEGQRVLVDVDLPDIGDMPSRVASVPSRGYNLSLKEMPPSQLQRLYLTHVHGFAFRIAAEVFADLPRAREVVLSGFTRRVDATTGHVRDDYLYSVRFDRQRWQRISFENLEALDVVQALEQFEMRRDMTKAGMFNAVEPFS
jgi:hypothetical protein